MWVDRDKPPNVIVREVDGGIGVGTTTFRPTASGLPGPLPSSAHFPNAGCWEISAHGNTGTATARVRVGETHDWLALSQHHQKRVQCSQFTRTEDASYVMDLGSQMFGGCSSVVVVVLN